METANSSSPGAFTGDHAVGSGVPAAPWFAVQTLYRYEFRVMRDLKAKGFDSYLPLLRETRQWTDRKKVVEVPAFNGYLFLRNDCSLRNRSRVLETTGVVRMLPDNHKPSPIAEIEIESLRKALDSTLPVTKCERPPEIGTLVEVKAGALAGVQGRVSRINNKFRLVLSVGTISQAISVEVDMNDVEPVGDPPAKAAAASAT
jgi:transcriptional antiterminator RfaH